MSNREQENKSEGLPRRSHLMSEVCEWKLRQPRRASARSKRRKKKTKRRYLWSRGSGRCIRIFRCIRLLLRLKRVQRHVQTVCAKRYHSGFVALSYGSRIRSPLIKSFLPSVSNCKIPRLLASILRYVGVTYESLGSREPINSIKTKRIDKIIN